MTPERWQRLEAPFEAAGARRRACRAYLDRECGRPSLRAEVEALLHEAECPGETLGAAFRRAVGDAGVAAPKEAGADGRIGTDVGAYRIVRELGRGGMGEVYYATHRRSAALRPSSSSVPASYRLHRFGWAEVARRLGQPPSRPSITTAGRRDLAGDLMAARVAGPPTEPRT